MREVVGLKTIDGVLTSDRKSIEPDVRDRMQKVLERLSRRRAGQAGAVAVGRRARAGDLRLSRRHRRAAGPAARRQRRRHLRQPRRARGGGRGLAHPRRGQGLQAADDPRREGSDGALQSDLRAVQEAPGRHARAHVSRDDGARARRHEQDDPRRERRRRRRCPISRSILWQPPNAGGSRRNEEPVRRLRRCSSSSSPRSSSRPTRSSPSIRPSRRWCCASASRCAI